MIAARLVALHIRVPFKSSSGQACPTPLNDKEKKLQEDEDVLYIRGRVASVLYPFVHIIHVQSVIVDLSRMILAIKVCPEVSSQLTSENGASKYMSARRTNSLPQSLPRINLLYME